MAHLVKVTARAERDLALLFHEISAERSDAAPKWYRGLKESILSLEQHPNRCRETPENAKLRHLLYAHKPHIYRVIYRVTGKHKQVDVLHIHGRRQRFKRSLGPRSAHSSDK